MIWSRIIVVEEVRCYGFRIYLEIVLIDVIDELDMERWLGKEKLGVIFQFLVLIFRERIVLFNKMRKIVERVILGGQKLRVFFSFVIFEILFDI